MNEDEPLIRNISDTARWVAFYRAYESERPDALFHDPFARRLAGPRGEQIAASMQSIKRLAWPFTTRTWLFDKIILEHVKQGTDMVINLAAGLDTRPYRMSLPASLQWIEVDLPEILAYKKEILINEKPVCKLEQIALDLSDINARNELFARLGSNSNKALIITEGLIIYLAREEVGRLATDLAAPKSFQRWILDIASPGLMRMMQKNMGSQLNRAGAPFKFAPEEGPDFFTNYSWQPIEVNSMFKTAGRLNRLPFFLMRLMAMLPESKGPKGSRPWSGVCLFQKQ